MRVQAVDGRRVIGRKGTYGNNGPAVAIDAASTCAMRARTRKTLGQGLGNCIRAGSSWLEQVLPYRGVQESGCRAGLGDGCRGDAGDSAHGSHIECTSKVSWTSSILEREHI